MKNFVDRVLTVVLSLRNLAKYLSKTREKCRTDRALRDGLKEN